MKKILSLIMVLSVCLGAWAQELTVADSESYITDTRIPVCGNYLDFTGKHTQFVYPAEMLTDITGADITGITFYARENIGFSGGVTTMSVKVIPEATILESVTEGLEQVFEGTFVIDGTKLTFTFDEPYTYDGGNLLFNVAWDGTGSYADASFVGIERQYASIWYSYSDYNVHFLPKATFYYNAEVLDYDARVSATEVAFGNVPTNNMPATQSVKVTNRGTNAITPQVTIAGDAFSTTYTATTIAKGESVEIPVAFSAEVAASAYTGTMTITAYDGEGGTFVLPLSGTAVEPVYELTVNDGTATSNYFPMYFYYWDDNCHTQTIYNRADLAELAGKKITTITYYPKDVPSLQLDGEMTLSIGTTSLDYFYGNETFIEATAVGKWSPNTDGSFVITLDTPYEYDGQSNLVLDWSITTAGSSYASGTFYGTQGSVSDATQTYSMYQYSAYPYTSSFRPKTTFGFADGGDQPQPAVPGDVNGDGEVNTVDITILYNYILNADTENMINGDQDGDGEITTVDITVVYNILLGTK